MAMEIIVSTGSGNGLVPIWHQAITWTNTNLMSIEPLHANLEIWLKTMIFIKKCI